MTAAHATNSTPSNNRDLREFGAALSIRPRVTPFAEKLVLVRTFSDSAHFDSHLRSHGLNSKALYQSRFGYRLRHSRRASSNWTGALKS